MGWDTVLHAFEDEPRLRDRVAVQIARNDGDVPSLLADIAQYVLRLKQSQAITQQPTSNGTSAEPSKKRKLEQHEHSEVKTLAASRDIYPFFQCQDVSFQVPARKKLRLQVLADSALLEGEVRLLVPQTNAVEYALDFSSIDQVFCLPVPDKQQRQWSFVVFPQPSAVGSDGKGCEQIVFTLSETPPAGVKAKDYAPGEGDTLVSVTEVQLNSVLKSFGKRVVKPDADEFASTIPQSHRKGEKAYHVSAHRGSKEGYLWFLPNGIVFGFKKPLAFFPFSSINSISYTSVLQRTFNLVIASEDSTGVIAETEFSMLDQADFAGIDDYIKRHGLNDSSMAAARKAKAYNVNRERKADMQQGSVKQEDEQSELRKAEQQLQDEEDDEEEDYEVSGGESDGEGEYSSDEEDDRVEGVAGQEGEYDEDDGEEE